jgi:hypothetical protein
VDIPSLFEGITWIAFKVMIGPLSCASVVRILESESGRLAVAVALE